MGDYCNYINNLTVELSFKSYKNKVQNPNLSIVILTDNSEKQIAKIFKNYVIKTFIKAIITVLIFNLGMSVVISMIVSESLGIGFKFNISYFSI